MDDILTEICGFMVTNEQLLPKLMRIKTREANAAALQVSGHDIEETAG